MKNVMIKDAINANHQSVIRQNVIRQNVNLHNLVCLLSCLFYSLLLVHPWQNRIVKRKRSMIDEKNRLENVMDSSRHYKVFVSLHRQKKIV